ncbi:MAG TPA: energy transducer TonB [Flavisolibacter sp.]|nr:energy transducer TonB [Flavisolibacter sp.]
MKNLAVILFCLIASSALAQGPSASFVDFQRTLQRPSGALKKKEDTLKRQFVTKGLQWPAKYIYIRSFKYDGQLEIWVKNERKEPFKLFKTYKVCAMAGTLGPKRMAGDYQVPEGFYYINEFNPVSNYHLSLGLNYPNASDKILSDSLRPGGDIYIHGSCVTVGCIPLTDEYIEEVYILAAYAKASGQDYIPVHIYPVRYNIKKSADYLTYLSRTDASLKTFGERLEQVYDHFEITHQLPVIMTDARGNYVYDGLSKKVAVVEEKKEKKVRTPIPHRTRNITDVADVVTQWPEFPGGGQSFLQYLDKMGKALGESLPANVKKANVVVEFIIDVDGVPTNFKVVQGVNEEFNDELIEVLEQMPTWQPAILNEKVVAKKMKQSFLVERVGDLVSGK